MNISSKDLYSLGFRYSWIHKHFTHLALETYVLIGHAQYLQYRVEDMIKYLNNYVGYCRNPIQEAKSKEMMNKLAKELNDWTI